MNEHVVTSKQRFHLNMPNTRMDTSEMEEVLTACALRFDGYAYDEWRAKEDAEWQGPQLIYEKVRDTGELRADENENFDIFFGLQRFLCKWGGEQLGWDSAERKLYGRLFLHLRKKECPEQFRKESYYGIWTKLSCQADEAAAKVEAILAKNGTDKNMSNNTPPVGRLERIDLRSSWALEPNDFTPWLAEPENIVPRRDNRGEIGGVRFTIKSGEMGRGPAGI